MKLRDVINSLDRTNSKLVTEPDWERISRQFNIDLPWSEDKRLKAYWLQVWYCTDTYVGIIAYFLDDEFVGISTQNGRKCDMDFEFVSEAIALQVRNYLHTLLSEDDQPAFDILDMDTEMGNGYTVTYNSQLIPSYHKKGMVKGTGEEVTIEETWRDYSAFHEVIVKSTEDGNKKLMDIRDIEFDYANTFENATFQYNKGYTGEKIK